jgi:hypothetical protein
MVTCGNCGNALLRLEREGLLERYILSLICYIHGVAEPVRATPNLSCEMSEFTGRTVTLTENFAAR